MGVGKIIQLVGVLVALVAGLMGGFPQSALLIAVLGLVGGYFIEKDDRMRFLVATVAVIAVSGTLCVMPEVVTYISFALGGLAALFSAAAVTAILVGTYEAVKP